MNYFYKKTIDGSKHVFEYKKKLDNNGNEIEFYVIIKKRTIDSILKTKTIPNLRKRDVQSEKSIIQMLNQEKVIDNLFKRVKKVLNRIIKKNGVFPTQNMPCEEICLELVDNDNLIAAVYNRENVTDIINIILNIWFAVKRHRLEYYLRHELYHIISTEQHDEVKALRKVKNISRKEAHKINNISKNIDSMIGHVKDRFSDVGLCFELLKVNEKMFYNSLIHLYWNVLADLGLHFIAVKLGDKKYARESMKDYKVKEYNLSKELKWNRIRQVHKNIQINKDTVVVNNFLKSCVMLFEFIEAYNSMPFNSIPYALFGSKWFPKNKINIFTSDISKQSQDIIRIYENMLHRNMHHQSLEKFMKFWINMKQIVIDMNAEEHIKDINIEAKIHNIQSYRSTEKGTQILYEEFYDLYNNAVIEYNKLMKN